jgi:hypothetical protein
MEAGRLVVERRTAESELNKRLAAESDARLDEKQAERAAERERVKAEEQQAEDEARRAELRATVKAKPAGKRPKVVVSDEPLTPKQAEKAVEAPAAIDELADLFN